MNEKAKKQDKSGRQRSRAAHTVDFGDLMPLILNYADSPEWKELAFAGKVRVLLRRVLETDFKAEEQRTGALKRFVQMLVYGQRPTEPDCIVAASFLDVDVEQLYALVDKILELSTKIDGENSSL